MYNHPSTCVPPLRYQISNWHQLSKCKSNNSKSLYISVTDFIQDNRLSGLRIQVMHNVFGALFTYIVGAKGGLVSKVYNSETHELSTDQILLELGKYGFYITFKEYENLGGDQLAYLMTLQSLHFDKLRLLNAWDAPNGVKEFTQYIVAFNVEQNPDWLNAGYAPSQSEFVEALTNGSAINLTSISETRNFRWDWLYNWVADIDDILKSNM